MRTRIGYALWLAAVALCAAAAPAFGALGLAAGTGATLAPFGPGRTATGTGALTATTVSLGGWTLTVQDQGAGAGRMRAAATGCSGSDVELTNPLSVTVTSAIGGISAGATSISATATRVAGGSGLLTSTLLTTSYSQVIPASQVMRTGCAYSLTATYTLQ